MFNRTRIAAGMTALACLASLCVPALAADVDWLRYGYH